MWSRTLEVLNPYRAMVEYLSKKYASTSEDAKKDKDEDGEPE